MEIKSKMREIEIEKVVLSISGSGEAIEKGVKLLELISERKAARKKSRKRIPSLNVRPGLEVGVMVTLRKEKAKEMLKKIIIANNNEVKESQISGDSLSFGIKEYIEIPGIKYQREIGIIGFDVSIAFARKGKRVGRRKIKRGRIPKRQRISKEEIVEYLNKMGIKVIGGLKWVHETGKS